MIKTKEYIKFLKPRLPIIILIAIVFFGLGRLVNYANYTEEYSCELEEIKEGTYAIYNTVSSNVPAHNYETVMICYDNKLHTFRGSVTIQQTDNTPHAEIISRPHMNYNDKITIYVPKGTVEFAEDVGMR